MPTFSAEVTTNGARIVDEHGRFVLGASHHQQANEMAELLNSGARFPGRALVLDRYNKAKRNDRNGEPRIANGKTCNSPIKGVKAPVVNSSRSRGF